MTRSSNDILLVLKRYHQADLVNKKDLHVDCTGEINVPHYCDGLLTSAVDDSSLLIPKGSEIVSARGRGFRGGVTFKLAVLINGQTASATEIVSGAIQDLEVGVIVGSDRSFGKGLVQNVEEVPFNTG